MHLLARRARRRRYRTGYLRSEHWVQFRRDWWRDHPAARCRRCGSDERPLDLHHLTYRRIGRERPSDVEPLCRRCHDQAHRAKRAKVKTGGAR